MDLKKFFSNRKLGVRIQAFQEKILQFRPEESSIFQKTELELREKPRQTHLPGILKTLAFQIRFLPGTYA